MMENGCDEINTTAGSNFYFSPEACKGSKFKGKGNDIWAAGVVLYYISNNKLPFEANSYPDLFHKIQFEEPDYVTTVLDPLLIDLLKKILEKDPD